jgi:hypothetical protein
MFLALLHDQGCWLVEAEGGVDDLGLEQELAQGLYMHRFRLKDSVPSA